MNNVSHAQYPPGQYAGRTVSEVRHILSKEGAQKPIFEGVILEGDAAYDYGNTGYPKIIRGGCFLARNGTSNWAPCKRTKANGDGTSTTALVVDNANHFAPGDSITVGPNAAQAIVSVDSATGITLTSAITWKDNDQVYVAAYKTARGVMYSDEVSCYDAVSRTAYIDPGVLMLVTGYIDQDKLLGDVAAILEDPESVAAMPGLIFDDYQTQTDTMPTPFRPFGLNKTKSISADYTITASDDGTLFVVKAAATLTLPTLALGLKFGFFNEADVNMTVAAPGSNDTIITFNDVAADSVAYSTAGNKIGAACVVQSNMDATKWWHWHLCKHTLTVA